MIKKVYKNSRKAKEQQGNDLFLAYVASLIDNKYEF